MPLPYQFANVTELDTPQIDANFAAVGALGSIPCTCSGTNALTLTPVANTPTVSAYTNLAPVFGFIAANTSTGVMTANVAGIGFVNLYKTHGGVQATTGDVVAGYVYYASFNQALNAGAGGLVLFSATFASTTSQFIIGSTSATVNAATTTYLGCNGAQATQNNTLCPVALTGIVSRVRVDVTAAPGAGQTFTYTLEHNGVDSVITGTISGASSFSFTSVTPLNVTQDDWLSIKLVTSGSAATVNHRYCIQIDP